MGGKEEDRRERGGWEGKRRWGGKEEEGGKEEDRREGGGEEDVGWMGR